MAQTQNQKKLLKILNEIFQLDQSDLDFGIYRIMNTKSQEINEFLDRDLLSSVASAFSSNDNNSIEKELKDKINSFREDGFTEEQIDNNKKIIALREQLSSTTSSNNLENEVFSHLANFFKRYYKDGDFVSLRRYKKDTYAIPYEGEEVKLHWANSDQYYIKSGEYFRDYTFKSNDKTIHLKLSDAETESNNNKATSDKERRFVYIGSEVLTSPKELNINFEYKAVGKGFKQDKLNEEAINKALEEITDEDFITALNTLAPTEKNRKRTIFEKHLKSYTSRNSFDYFIHKDLGGFLGRELDFYIKNEMLFLDDIMDSPIKYEEVMGKIKIFKEVSQKIIAFLTSLEELQKKLWEKKKFIIETNYCITLDKINEDYYEQILSCKEQLAEWKELFNVDIQSIEDLKEEKYLVLDTKFFDMKFKYKLLSEFDNLDEEIDGVLINSENFGALNLLQNRYREQVKTVYIDPPYNTGSDGFLYSDSFQHSSWMSFMYDRLALSRELISDDGIFISHIDENENTNLDILLEQIFNISNNLGTIVWDKRNPKGDATGIAQQHELINFYTKNMDTFKSKVDFVRPKENAKLMINKVNQLIKLEGKVNSNVRKKYKDWLKKQPFSGGEKAYSFIDDKNEVYRPVSMAWPNKKKAPDNYYIPLIHPITNKNCPVPERGWRNPPQTMEDLNNKNLILFGKDETTQPNRKYLLSENLYENVSSLLYYAGSDDSILSDLGVWFDTPKVVNVSKKLLQTISINNNIIIDYFAGSGTTGHAVINLNREDNGKRKYLLVEMGEYFDTVTKPRIQKVIYSDSWKDGKPTTKNGVSQIFKYFKLESYEDTLNNLEFKKTEAQQKAFDFHPEAKEDYILNYSLDVESQGSLLSIDTFSTPFDYKLKIATSSVGETKDTNIDLVETFNYLLGLVVKRIELLYPKGISSQAHGKGYLIVEGQNLKKEKILIIWRDGRATPQERGHSSDELNEFFKKMDWQVYDREFDTIYVNGDNNLDNLRKDEDHYKVKLIEQEFKRLMFNE